MLRNPDKLVVNSPEQWKFSSARYYILGKSVGLPIEIPQQPSQRYAPRQVCRGYPFSVLPFFRAGIIHAHQAVQAIDAPSGLAQWDWVTVPEELKTAYRLIRPPFTKNIIGSFSPCRFLENDIVYSGLQRGGDTSDFHRYHH